MTKIKNIKAAALLMVFRDKLKKEATEMLREATLQFESAEKQAAETVRLAKITYHTAKIKHNQLQKEADYCQECISEEMQLEIKNDNEAAEQYSLSQNCILQYI